MEERHVYWSTQWQRLVQFICFIYNYIDINKSNTYGFLCKQSIMFLELGLQPKLWATCNVYGVGSFVIAQSDSADPDISIARWNNPESYDSLLIYWSVSSILLTLNLKLPISCSTAATLTKNLSIKI